MFACFNPRSHVTLMILPSEEKETIPLSLDAVETSLNVFISTCI